MRRCPKIEYGGMYWEIVEQSANDYRSNNDLMECKQNNKYIYCNNNTLCILLIGNMICGVLFGHGGPENY